MWNPFRRTRLSTSAKSANFKEVMRLAYQEAVRLDNDVLHTAHFLLAVIADESSSLYQHITQPPVDVAKLKHQLENSVKGRRQRQHGILVTGSLLLSREFEGAYDYSFREAFNAGAKQVEPIHLAIGIFNQALSSSAPILQSFGISVETLRTLSALNPSPSEDTK